MLHGVLSCCVCVCVSFNVVVCGCCMVCLMCVIVVCLCVVSFMRLWVWFETYCVVLCGLFLLCESWLCVCFLFKVCCL